METTDMDEPITLKEYKNLKMVSMDIVRDLNNSSVFKKPFNVPDSQDIDTDFSTSASRVQVNYAESNSNQATLMLPPINMISHNGFWQQQCRMNCDEGKSQFKNLEDPIVITCWSPLLLLNNKLGFIGISPSNCLVKFSNIRKRLSRSKMSDMNGIVYMLYGPMNPKKDLPQYIRTKFTSGIPENWKELCFLWGRYVDMGCPMDFCWCDENSSEVTETNFIEKKPRKMIPLSSNGAFNCINPSITNSCSLETSSTKSYTSIMLKKKIAKLQAMLRSTLLRESMCSQHPDDTATDNIVTELSEHRKNSFQHPNPLLHDTGTTPVLHKDSQREPNDNTFINQSIDNLKALPDKSVDTQQTPVKDANNIVIIQNRQTLSRTKKKNNQGSITSLHYNTRLMMKRRKVFAKNRTAKKDNTLQPFIVENTTVTKLDEKDLNMLSNSSEMQMDLFQWRPVLSIERNSCIMRIKGYDQQNQKMRLYMTDEICKRLSNYRVVDKAGVEYRLVGQLTDPHNELPDLVNSSFKRGITKDWRTILSNHYRQELSSYRMPFDSQNMSMSVSQLDLTISKRGRRIIPRLNYWLGERISIRAGETFIDRSTVQDVDKDRIQKGRNKGKSMSVPSSSTPITSQVRLIPLDESFIYEFPSEDRPIVIRFLKKMSGKRLMGSQTTMVEPAGTTSHRGNFVQTPKINAASTLKNVTFGSSLERNDKENKEKNSKGTVLASKVMKPKQRVRKQQLKVGDQFLHQICSLLKPKNIYETEIKLQSVQTSSQASVVSDSNMSIFQNVMNGSYIPKKRKLFSMNNVDYQFNDVNQATSTAAVRGAPRFTVTWNDAHCISDPEKIFSEVSVLK